MFAALKTTREQCTLFVKVAGQPGQCSTDLALPETKCSLKNCGKYKVCSPLIMMGRQKSAAGRSRLAYRSQWVTLLPSQCILHCCHISLAIICCIVWVFLFISLLQITLLECCCLLWCCNLQVARMIVTTSPR